MPKPTIPSLTADGIYTGHLLIRSDKDAAAAAGVRQVTGNLEIDQVKFNAPDLRSVGGTLKVGGVSAAVLPACKFVGGHVLMTGIASLDAPVLESIAGNMHGDQMTTMQLPELVSVGSSDPYAPLSIALQGECKVVARKLGSTAGGVHLHNTATLEAPLLALAEAHAALSHATKALEEARATGTLRAGPRGAVHRVSAKTLAAGQAAAVRENSAAERKPVGVTVRVQLDEVSGEYLSAMSPPTAAPAPRKAARRARP